MTPDQWVTAGIPTLAVIVAFIRNEAGLASLGRRIDNLESGLTTRIANLERRLDETGNRLEGKIDKLSARVDSLWDRVPR